MKLTIAFIISLVILSYASAQTSTTDSQLIPYRQGSKWGYCDVNKKIIIACGYDHVSPFSEGLAAVTVNEKVGYIDKTGKLIIAYTFGEAGPFNRKGSAVVDFNSMTRGLARINRSGQVIDDKYCKWMPNVLDPYFVCGLTLVTKEENSGKNKDDFINESGELVIPFTYAKAHHFSEDVTSVFDGDRKWAWIDKKGKQLTPYEELGYGDFNDGVAVIYKANLKTFESRGVGYIDHSFKKVFIPDTQISLLDFGEGLFLARKNNRMGFVDKTGKVVIPFIYTEQEGAGESFYGSVFKDGIAIVSKNNKVGLINKKGEPVTPFIYDRIGYNDELNLFQLSWQSPDTAPYLQSGYMSAQGVKYWADKQTEISDYKQRALKNLASYNPPNKPANLAKTCSYAKMYLSNPKLFKWAGLAALVSGRVGEESELMGSGLVDKFTGYITEAIFEGNKRVYLDLYWQHLLIQEEGLPGIERAYAEHAIDKQSYKGWVKILSAKSDNDIWEGNKDLLYYEQSEILQKAMYTDYSKTWNTITNNFITQRILLKNPVPPGNELLFSADDFNEKPVNLANLEDRWNLIQRKILPSWKAFESNPANKPMLIKALQEACPVLR